MKFSIEKVSRFKSNVDSAKDAGNGMQMIWC